MSKLLSLSLAVAVAFGAAAQTQSFDLSSQRKEIRVVNPVPGKVVDHRFVINPTPQQMTVNESKQVDVARGFTLKDKTGAMADAASFLPQGTLPVTVSTGFKKFPVKPVSGAYRLTVNPKGIKIEGFDDRGAFYGLQTLRQILDGARDGKVPSVEITDYPSLPFRGVVEGFYGTPWSHEVRLSLIDFYGKNKMNVYLYGPKDDPYHSSPYWRQPYPADEARKIHELAEAAKRNRVDFVWAIHPGKDIRWTKQDYDSLVSKFNMMYDLGVRSFAIFFDDIEGEGTNPVRQVELLNNLNRDFVKAKGDVSDLVVCPTDYSRLWAKTGEDGPLATYGRTLDKNINVMYTGDVVCSDLTKDTMTFFDNLVKRPGYYWWNWPVSDYCRNYILQGPAYGLDTTLTTDDLVAIVSNPMEHGEASKLGLYGVADYGWNIPAYNPMDNWTRGLAYLMPDDPEAYRLFAIHSADTETGYRRDESWETNVMPYGFYPTYVFDTLRTELKEITTLPERFDRNCHNPLLLKELKPWVDQLAKVGERGLTAIELMECAATGDLPLIWNKYAATMPDTADLAAFDRHRAGTMKLNPFYINTVNDLMRDLYLSLTGYQSTLYRPIGSFENLSSNITASMLDADTTTHYTSGDAQKEGSWIGLDLLMPRRVNEISIRQGRNSVDDCDFFDHAVLEYYAGDDLWLPLTDELTNTYDIVYTPSERYPAPRTRYVRLRRLPSERKNWTTVRTFEVNPARPVTDDPASVRLVDQNPLTHYTLSQPLTLPVPEGKIRVIMLTKDGATVNGKRYDEAFVDITGPGTTIEIAPGAQIHEIVFFD